jgi:glycosyltransferase involved in cell wall biosynthesis
VKSGISLIIPTCDRPAALGQCLRAIISSPVIVREIIVCDDGRDDRTRRLIEAEFPEVRRLAGPRSGPGANRNSSARTATGEWLLFVDDDCIPRPGFLEACQDAIHATGQSGGSAVFSGKTLATGGSVGSLLWEAPCYDGRGLPPSCNFAIRSDVFEKSGGFDGRYQVSFEDIEFFARLEASGYPIRYVPAMLVEHPRRRIPGPSRLAARWEGRVISTLDFGALPRIVTPLVLRHCTAVILSRFRENPLRWDTPIAAAVFALEWLQVVRHLPGWVKKWSGQPRSPFWVAKANSGEIPPRYGL